MVALEEFVEDSEIKDGRSAPRDGEEFRGDKSESECAGQDMDVLQKQRESTTVEDANR